MSTENLQLRAGEVMDVLVRVAPQTPLRTVIRRILVSGAAAAAVVDDRGQLSGLITSRELARGDDAAEMLTAGCQYRQMMPPFERALWFG
jgi:Mg/Co/Ni transporter MgtE